MTFAARYPGRCHAGCGESIEPGDLVRYEEEALVHVDCPMTAHEPDRTPCPTCWLTSCDCENES